MAHYDAIVFGGGTMGTAAAWELGKRGLKALVLEQFEHVHANGAHSGESRIIRHAYAEGPDYVPLVFRADDLVATQPPVPLPQQPAGWWDMPATSMIHAVETILPDGVVVIDRGSVGVGTPDGDLASSSIDPDLEGPAGPGSINIILYPGPAQGTGEIGTDVEAGCGGVRTSNRARCEELLDTAGDVIGRRLTERWSGGVVINEVVLRRDGGTVYSASANTLDDKWGADSPRSASRPPLTLDQLEDLVRNDVWVSYPR